MKYTVSVIVKGIIEVEVEARDLVQAKWMAIDEVANCDFNRLDNIDIDPYDAEDENGELYVF